MPKRKRAAKVKQSLSRPPKRSVPKSVARGREMIEQTKANQREARIARALKATGKFRPKKTDRGNFVAVGTDGKRLQKGKKGYLVYVDSKGRKAWQWKRDDSFLAKKIRRMEVPFQKGRKQAAKRFLESQVEVTGKGLAAVKGSGKIKPKGPYDFNDSVVNKMAGGIGKILRGQRSNRAFLLNALVLVTLPDGGEKVYNVKVPIQRADHVAIERGGIINFLRHKFYAFMARELAFDGYVTSGSSNHIRALKENKGKQRKDWTKDGQVWEGWDYQTVKIAAIDWEMQQLKFN